MGNSPVPPNHQQMGNKNAKSVQVCSKVLKQCLRRKGDREGERGSLSANCGRQCRCCLLSSANNAQTKQCWAGQVSCLCGSLTTVSTQPSTTHLMQQGTERQRGPPIREGKARKAGRKGRKARQKEVEGERQEEEREKGRARSAGIGMLVEKW